MGQSISAHATYPEEVTKPPSHNQYEDVVKLAQFICQTEIAGISIKDENKFIVKTILGAEIDSVTDDLSFWKHNQGSDTFIINDAQEDERVSSNPLVKNSPHVRFYMGTAIKDEQGDLLGVLFACDPGLIELSRQQIALFEAQARQIGLIYKSQAEVIQLEQTTKELDNANSKLAQHEEHYQSILDSAADMVFELDKEGNFLYTNHLSQQITGYSQTEFTNMKFVDLVSRGQQRKLTRFYEGQVAEHNEDSYGEFQILTKSGDKLWVGIKAHINYDADFVKNITLVARDISKQKEATSKLARYRNGLKLINEIASNVNFSLTEQLYLALEVGSSYLGLEVAAIGQVIGDRYYVRHSQLAHPEYGITLKESYLLKEVFSEVTYHQDEVISISHIKQSEYEDHPCYKMLQIEAYIGTPYYIKGKKEGTVSFFSLTPREVPFDDNEIDFIKIFARWIGFILERERNQDSLLSEKGMLSAFASFSPAAIAMFNQDMEYLAATEKWITQNRLEGVELIGKSHYELAPKMKDEWIDSHQRALRGEVVSKEEDQYINELGEKVWLTWEVRPWYNEDQEIGGIILFTQDITLQKAQAEELIRAKEAAEMASYAKDQFLSTMSHEIRTPLNAVIGAGHLLLHENPREDQVQNLTLLKNSGEHLMSLVNDILDFNKIEEGQLKLEEVSFDFQKLIATIHSSMQYAADDNNIALKWNVEEAIPKVLKGDPTRINQILINLINNAIKFTEKGHVKLSVQLRSLEAEKVCIYFEVEDTGIGITPEQQETIFDRFKQADEDTTRKYGGSGLGLTITRRLLQLMGSDIHLESKLKQGSKFFFELTLETGDKSKVVNKKLKKDKIVQTGSTKNILLVDDHEVNRIMASKFLSKWGLTVECATNGRECVEMIASKKYDLVLMDLQMPEMGGFEATKIIRNMEDAYFKEIPIIALTAAAMVEAREEVKKVGMNDFLTKPFNPKVFKTTLSTYLKETSIA